MFAATRSFDPSSYAAAQKSKSSRNPKRADVPSPAKLIETPTNRCPETPEGAVPSHPATTRRSDTRRTRSGSQKNRSEDTDQRRRRRRRSSSLDRSSTVLGGAAVSECCFCLRSVDGDVPKHRCLECQDVYLCSACLLNAGLAHPGHKFAPSDNPQDSAAKQPTISVPSNTRPKLDVIDKREPTIKCCFCMQAIVGVRYECQNCPGTVNLHEDCLRLHPPRHIMEVISPDVNEQDHLSGQEGMGESSPHSHDGAGSSARDDSVDESARDDGDGEAGGDGSDDDDVDVDVDYDGNDNDGNSDSSYGIHSGNKPDVPRRLGSPDRGGLDGNSELTGPTALKWPPNTPHVNLSLSTKHLMDLAQSIGQPTEEAAVARVGASLGKYIEEAIVAALGPTVKRMVEDTAEAYVAAALRARPAAEPSARKKRRVGPQRQEDEASGHESNEASERRDRDEDGDEDRSDYDILDFEPDVGLERHISRKRQWGPGDKRRLCELKAKGWSDGQIGAAIDRTASAVGQQWTKMKRERRARI